MGYYFEFFEQDGEYFQSDSGSAKALPIEKYAVKHQQVDAALLYERV
jgi:hypothetical protein